MLVPVDYLKRRHLFRWIKQSMSHRICALNLACLYQHLNDNQLPLTANYLTTLAMNPPAMTTTLPSILNLTVLRMQILYAQLVLDVCWVSEKSSLASTTFE